MESRLAEHPDDAQSALLLADALLRQARATTDGRPAGRAATVLAAVLNNEPDQDDALRLLGAVHLSRHMFRDALEVAKRARDARPSDAWNYGVMGDALLELGEDDEAFRAFDTMVTLRPNADAYARVSYGRELRGNLPGALDAMQMAADATSGHDREAKAWYTAHVGELHLRMGRLADAEREYRRAAFYFPDYPHATVGLGKVKAARGDTSAALEIFKAQLGGRRRWIWRRGPGICWRPAATRPLPNTITAWPKILPGLRRCRPRRTSPCSSWSTIGGFPMRCGSRKPWHQSATTSSRRTRWRGRCSSAAIWRTRRRHRRGRFAPARATNGF